MLYFEEEIAGVFDAPTHVRNFEFRGSLPVVAGKFGVDQRGESVIGAMQVQGAVEFDVADAGRRNLAFNLCGMKNGVGKFGGFENFPVHASVAAVAAAFAAGGEDDDFAGGFAGFGIKVNVAGLEVECSVHGVQGGVDRKMDFGLSGVEGQNCFGAGCGGRLLAGRRGRSGEKQYQRERCYRCHK